MFLLNAPGPVHNVSAGNILGPSQLGILRVHTIGGKLGAANKNRGIIFREKIILLNLSQTIKEQEYIND